LSNDPRVVQNHSVNENPYIDEKMRTSYAPFKDH